MSLIMTLDDLVAGTSGQVRATQDTSFSGIATDTRTSNSHRIFFALKGDRFDAHDFLPKAVESGAAALVVSRPLSDADLRALGPVTVIQTQDTLVAMQKFATYWRRKQKVKVVGIAGSNGKTTTKNFAGTLIGAYMPALHTKGSLNNHFGVPMTLLSLTPEHRVAVVEMGMNHALELKALTEIAEPDAVLVTTIAHEHIEFFGSLEKIAEAEEEIYRYSSPSCVRIFNLDNPYTKSMYQRYRSQGKTLTFSSLEAGADVQLKEVVSKLAYLEITGTIGGEPGRAKVPVFGRHNTENLMAAAAAALAVGIEPDRIWKKIETCRGEWGRGQILDTSSGAKVVFDAYNANLESSLMLLDNFSRISVTGRRIGVFADMLELGAHSAEHHEKWGEAAGRAGLDMIWFYGQQREAFERGLRTARFSKRLYISTVFDEAVAQEIGTDLTNRDVILVKGSRGMKLERAVAAWHPVDFNSHY